MVLEIAFDMSSRFLAAGTTDSQIKVYDYKKGFQTHNLLGHKGLIVKLYFVPEAETLTLVSTAEDCTIRV